jgi:glucosyl-dolichyl phosphate glucuronosyltransferase
MRGNPTVDHAIVDTLHTLLEGNHDVHIVGALSAGARERLAVSLGEGLSIAEQPDPSCAQHGTVVVLDAQRLREAQAALSPAGTLTVAVVNPCYGSFLVEVLEGSRIPCREAIDLDGVCERLEGDGWEVGEATPVAVPLALIPFDPARVPKTILAYLYAQHPEIETYCFLVQARRPGTRPRRPRSPARVSSADFPTMPWKTEAEWSDEARSGIVNNVDERLQRSNEELLRIKSSLAWRAIARYRDARERLLPPRTRRGRLYERARFAIGRLVVRGRVMPVAPRTPDARSPERALATPTLQDRPALARAVSSSDVLRASVIVCTHNGGALVEGTLESLVSQDFPAEAFEILVVDNASTDATPEVIRGIAGRHPGRIRIVREDVLGLSSARNRGVREARGEVLAFTDDDARASPVWLRALVDTCERPGIGCAGGPVLAVPGEPLPEWVTRPFLQYLALFDKGAEEVELFYNEYPRGVNMAYPRRSFREVGLFSPAFGVKGHSLLCYEEIELCYRLERLGRRILYVPDAGVSHVIRAERLTVAWFKRRFYAQGKSEAYFDLVHHGPKLVVKRVMERGRFAWGERTPAGAGGSVDLHRHSRIWSGLGYGVGAVQGWTTGISRRARPAAYVGQGGATNRGMSP